MQENANVAEDDEKIDNEVNIQILQAREQDISAT